jgi:hypothetical protein
MSVFPIGSIVELSDGSRAKVVRANPGRHTRPVVVAVDDGGAPTGDMVDLGREASLAVVRELGFSGSDDHCASLPATAV